MTMMTLEIPFNQPHHKLRQVSQSFLQGHWERFRICGVAFMPDSNLMPYQYGTEK